MSNPQDFRKTVSFHPNSTQPTQVYNNPNVQDTANRYSHRPSSSIGYNQINQGNFNARPSTTTTTFNQGASQTFTNNSIILGGNFGGNTLLGRNPSVVVKPDSLVKIEIYSPELNGSRNRHYSERLAIFIKSLNTVKARAIARDNYTHNTNNIGDDNSFVNGGVWAKSFQNRNAVTIVINGVHIVEDFPLTIFNEDPNWNYNYEMKNYRGKFIDTISQFSDCKFLINYDF